MSALDMVQLRTHGLCSRWQYKVTAERELGSVISRLDTPWRGKFRSYDEAYRAGVALLDAWRAPVDSGAS